MRHTTMVDDLDNHDLLLVGGSVGGTPHSGTPFGRCILFGSHLSSAAELNFYR